MIWNINYPIQSTNRAWHRKDFRNENEIENGNTWAGVDVNSFMAVTTNMLYDIVPQDLIVIYMPLYTVPPIRTELKK